MADRESLTLDQSERARGAHLHWRRWMPGGEPKAVILLAHGYAEHIGRYGHVAAYFNTLGFAVYALDHWGHGQSDGRPGYVPRFSVYLDGVETLLAKIEAAFPATPRILLGHSMGGLIAATHLITHQSHYAAAALSGPAILPAAPPSRLMIWVSRLLSRIAPRLGVLKLDIDGVSRDPAVVAAYRADPLVYSGKMSARLAAEMFDAMIALRAGADRITLPLALFHGEQDRLTAPAGSLYLFDHVQSGDKQIKFYPGLFHEIFNEPEQAAVLGDVGEWISKQLTPKSVQEFS